MEQALRVGLLMANLPYIRHDEMTGLAVSRYEPHMALDGGVDGMGFIRELIQQIPAICEAACDVLLEIGAEQGSAVENIVRQNLNVGTYQIIQDYAGLDRIVHFQLR